MARGVREPKPVAVVPIKEFLHHAHNRLLELQRRQFLLEAINAEWAAITRGASYWLHDDAAFRAIVDVDAMKVIDLCSWALGASDSDESLLLRVKNHYLADLPPSRSWDVSGSGPLVRMTDARYADARARLFPKAAGRALAEGDAEDLIESFEKRIRPLVDDRNANRAHAYEHRGHGPATPLELSEVRGLYEDSRHLLNDLCLVAFGDTWKGTDVNSNSVRMTAEDMLDVVFLPNWFRREVAGRGTSRKGIYDALHADPGPGPFNDPVKLKALASRLAPSGN